MNSFGRRGGGAGKCGRPLPHRRISATARAAGRAVFALRVWPPTRTRLKVPSPPLPLPLKVSGPGYLLGRRGRRRFPPLPAAEAGQLLRCHDGVTQQSDLATGVRMLEPTRLKWTLASHRHLTAPTSKVLATPRAAGTFSQHAAARSTTGLVVSA